MNTNKIHAAQPCQNIDGQCSASWCDCDYQRVKRRMWTPALGAPNHVRIEIATEQGNNAVIMGDPKMSDATKKALGAMVDAAVKAANEGKL